MWPYKTFRTVLLLSPIVFSISLALDVYMPVIPEMIDVLKTSKSMIQLTLSAFFLVTGFGQLILGPLSDQYGRYTVLLISAILFTLASLLCALSHTVEELIFYRFIQGIGSCGQSVTAFAIVRDSFHGRTSAVIYSFLNAGVSFSPIAGPIIGIFLASIFPWNAIFFFLSFLGLVNIILIILFYKESLPLKKRRCFDKHVFSRYYSVVFNLRFWSYTIPAVAGMSTFFTVFSVTPYIMQALNEPRSQIGIFFGLAGIAFLGGSIVSGYIIKKVGIFFTIIIGSISIFLSGFTIIVIYLFKGLSLWGFFIPSTLGTFGCALTAGSGASGAMEPFGDYPGVASAMFGALEIGGSAIIGSIGVSLCSSPMSVGVSSLVCSSIGLLLLKINGRS